MHNIGVILGVMNTSIAVIGSVCMLLGIGSSSAAVTVDLSAKSYHGKFGEKIIPLQTEFGIVRVPTRVIDKISPDDDGKSLILNLKNRDEITGIPERSTLSVVTKNGVVKIPLYGSGNLGVYVFNNKAGGIDVYPLKNSPPDDHAKDMVVHFTFDGRGNKKILNRARPADPAAVLHGLHQDGIISLDGQGDHLLFANNKSFEALNGFTLSIWVNLNNYAPGGYANEHGYFVNKGRAMWWNPAWCLGYGKKRGNALFTVGTEKSQGRAKCRLASKTKLLPGEWYHLVGTYDGNHASIYINGRMEGRIPYQGEIRRDKAPLLLGGSNLKNTSFGNHFTTNAHMDDFRLYNRALAPGEVRGLYKCAPTHPPGSPVK